jgi:hypothetical protein
MSSHSRLGDYVVGIDFENPYDYNEDRSHMTLRRKVSMTELVEEIQDIIQNGCTYPKFPPEANPSITYACDLSNNDDGDIYHELMFELEKHNRKEVIY